MTTENTEHNKRQRVDPPTPESTTTLGSGGHNDVAEAPHREDGVLLGKEDNMTPAGCAESKNNATAADDSNCNMADCPEAEAKAPALPTAVLMVNGVRIPFPPTRIGDAPQTVAPK